MRMVQCPKCGKRVEAIAGAWESTLCVACGTRFEVKGAPARQRPDLPAGLMSQAAEVRKALPAIMPETVRNRYFIAGLTIAVCVILIATALAVMKHRDETGLPQAVATQKPAMPAQSASMPSSRAVVSAIPARPQSQPVAAHVIEPKPPAIVARSFVEPAIPTSRPSPEAPTSRYAARRIVVQSDFPPEFPPATEPAKAILVARRTGVSQDEDIGQAIEHGVDFILTQFKDGDLSTAPELSDSQRQSLVALCVYSLAQAGQAVSDPRLNPRGNVLPAMLTRLAGFPILGDAEKTNRPITYGRSLRAAALATYDRPEDRKTLKADVEWLIEAQINGAYSYDDLYRDLMKKGMKPSSVRPALPEWRRGLALPSDATGDFAPDDTRASVILAQDFGGGSPDPGLTGPYGPPISPLPPMPTPVSPAPMPMPNAPMTPGISSSPGSPHPPVKIVPGPMIPNWPRPVPLWWKSTPGRSNGPQGNYIGPKVSGSSGAPSGGPTAPGSVRPFGDNNAPPLDLQFQFPWDNSNSQYGLLGVWAGAEVGIEVPLAYWEAVERHWVECELANGQWAYRKNDAQGTFSMTCGGVASLLVTHDYLDLPMLKGAVGREPYSTGLAAGLGWLDKGNNGINTPNPGTHYLGYDIYGLERVGLASGYKYFGRHDWYRELSQKIVAKQHSNGAWGFENHGIDTLVDTAYTLLFLSRGRHPILMTKLKFDRYWDNRPRDAANLAKFASKQLERQVNWQVVGIEHTWDEWFDSPVVYIASHQAPRLSDRDFAELRKFALAGGLIFTHADVSSGTFDQWAGELAKRIAPGRPFQPIPSTDPLYSLLYKLPDHRPLMGVSNGVRWLMVHSPNDIALSWQMRSDKTRLQDFQLGINLFLYAAGKPDLRNRIDSPFIAEPRQPPTRLIRIARLQYDGNWNPEPAAWGRFSRWLHVETGEALTLMSAPLDKIPAKIAPIAVLTGTGPRDFSKVECDAMTEYVKSGGMLLIDACGGDNNFKLSVREKLLPVAFAAAKATPLPAPLSIPMRLRPFSVSRQGAVAASQIQLLSLGKGYVVFSPLDLTNALLGTNTWGVDGYQPASAQAFLKNLIQWAEHQ
jgi:hypothetical protein